MKPQKTTEVEVLVVLSPLSGGDSTRFRVAMHTWQLQDMLQHASYAGEVFDAFRITVCEGLKLDADTCNLNVRLNAGQRFGTEDGILYTGDVLSELLFLH